VQIRAKGIVCIKTAMTAPVKADINLTKIFMSIKV
jgi:hypothetical protein